MIGRVLVGSCGAAFGLWFGLAASACSIGGDCDCPPPGTVTDGTFRVSAVNPRAGENAPPFELENATVTITEQAVTVGYSRAGTDVTVTYNVLRKY